MSTSPIPPVLDQDRYAVYQPTAATTDFALGFPLFGEAADIAVYLNGSPLAVTTDYTVRSTANGANLTPAPVTDAYVRLKTSVASGKLEIFGNFRPRRTIQASAPYGTRDFNFAFSMLMAALREMWSKFTRALKVPAGEAEITIPSVTDRSGQVLAFDDAGKPTIGGRYADLMASASAATLAASNAVASAQAAAASAAAAALFDTASYYLRTAFRSDGTADAPIKYGPAGQISSKLSSIDGPTGTVRRRNWTTNGLNRFGMYVNQTAEGGANVGSDFGFSAYDDAGALIGNIFAVERATQLLTFAKMPLVAGTSLSTLLGGLKNVRFITASGNVQPSAGATKWFGFLVGGGAKGGDTSGQSATLGGSGGAGCLFLAAVSDATPYAAVIGGVGGNSSLVVAATTYSAQGSGGVATNGLVNLSGAIGTDATVTGGSPVQVALGGDGGDGPFGFGTGGGGGKVSNWNGSVTHPGGAASGFGAGGGGSAGLGGSGAGGAGSPGCLLILEF